MNLVPKKHVHVRVFGVHIQMYYKCNKFIKMHIHVHVFDAHIQMCHKFNKLLKMHVHVFGAHNVMCYKCNKFLKNMSMFMQSWHYFKCAKNSTISLKTCTCTFIWCRYLNVQQNQ